MATKVILPKLGQTMEEGTIVEWMVKEGDKIDRGDVLFQVESDKAVLEAESSAKGTVLKILAEKGAKVPVLSTIAIVGEPGEDISALLAAAGASAPAAAPAAPAASAAPEAAPVAPTAPAPEAPQPIQGRERIFASPRAKMTAAEKGIDLAYVAGSGPEGRVVEKDVLAFAAKQPAATPLAKKVAEEVGIALGQVPVAGGRITAADVRAATAPAAAPVAAPVAAPAAPAAISELTPLSGVRAIIADRMGTSAHTTAAVTLQSVVDVTEFVTLRIKLKETFAKELGFDIGYNDILAYIVARCLVEFPYMNVRLEGKNIRHLGEVNMGLAVDSERGLLVPVVRGADKLGIKEFAKRFRELVAKARDGKAGPDDLTGGTFTITNLGMFGVDMFTPIINLPECAILGVGRIRQEPAVVNGQVLARAQMWLSLTFDHRLVDGAPAARFLQGIMRYIETPYLLLA